MILVNLTQDKSNLNKYISNTLIKKIEEKLKKNEKIILYLNKRWEYSSLICENCNHLYKCENCDISLSVHKYPEKLICHLCKNIKNIPLNCEKCWSSKLNKVWIWTQQIEDSMNLHFKDNKIFRFDTDTIKKKSDKDLALQKLEESDIIIWTKMITTWFDFKKVGLIWVILLEQELLIPKYNTEEKLYSNIKQLIWRWSRVWQETEVVIQTFIPENEIIKDIVDSNYKDFFIKTLKERKIFKYPPFTEMLKVEYRDKSKDKSKDFINKIKNKLEIEKKDKNIEITLTPNPNKRYNQYYYQIIVKWENLREFISCIKYEILRNSGLNIIFEY